MEDHAAFDEGCRCFDKMSGFDPEQTLREWPLVAQAGDDSSVTLRSPPKLLWSPRRTRAIGLQQCHASYRMKFPECPASLSDLRMMLIIVKQPAGDADVLAGKLLQVLPPNWMQVLNIRRQLHHNCVLLA
jgi:hypothetical protein